MRGSKEPIGIVYSIGWMSTFRRSLHLPFIAHAEPHVYLHLTLGSRLVLTSGPPFIIAHNTLNFCSTGSWLCPRWQLHSFCRGDHWWRGHNACVREWNRFDLRSQTCFLFHIHWPKKLPKEVNRYCFGLYIKVEKFRHQWISCISKRKLYFNVSIVNFRVVAIYPDMTPVKTGSIDIYVKVSLSPTGLINHPSVHQFFSWAVVNLWCLLAGWQQPVREAMAWKATDSRHVYCITYTL